jgi:hypothetical protein
MLGTGDLRKGIGKLALFVLLKGWLMKWQVDEGQVDEMAKL